MVSHLCQSAASVDYPSFLPVGIFRPQSPTIALSGAAYVL